MTMRAVFHQRLGLGVVTLALLLRMLVPAGFMPDLDQLARGIVQLKLCNNHGGTTIWVDKNLHKVNYHHLPQEHKENTLCPFSSVLPAFTPAAPPLILIAVLLFFTSIWLSLRENTITQILNRAAQSRAPPILQL
jgi:hypothetical protein